jgi:ferredoxin--NADP+ reductase
MSIIQDPSVYEKYEKVILTHGVRDVSELAYEDFILSELPRNEFFGNEVRNQLIYYPTVTREDFKTTGRLTDHMSSGELFDRIGLPQPNPSDDRFMICGGPSMLKDTCEILDRWNFEESRQGIKAGYVIERAFVE